MPLVSRNYISSVYLGYPLHLKCMRRAQRRSKVEHEDSEGDTHMNTSNSHTYPPSPAVWNIFSYKYATLVYLDHTPFTSRLNVHPKFKMKLGSMHDEMYDYLTCLFLQPHAPAKHIELEY